MLCHAQEFYYANFVDGVNDSSESCRQRYLSLSCLILCWLLRAGNGFLLTSMNKYHTFAHFQFG